MVAWYKHDIPKWMDSTGGLPDGSYRALHVICELIYLNEGPIRLHEQGIAGRCNQHILAFRKNLNTLLTLGLLRLNPDGTLDEPTANLELDRIGRNRVNAGLGGKGRYKSLENKDAAIALLENSSAHKTREDKTREEKKDAAGAAIVNLFPESIPDIPADRQIVKADEAPDAILFREGRKVLGSSAGGMITKLLKSQNGNVALARAAIMTASTKDRPREYVGRIISGRDRDEMGAQMAPGYGDDWG